MKLALLTCAASALAAGTLLFAPAASAVVYCKAAGVPKGCVARPAAPAARAAVHCTRPGYPVGCVPGAGAPGVGVAPAASPNLGGPVNRVGLR